MSHFNVAVFSHSMDEIEGLMAPFCEEVEAGSPYAEFVPYEDEEYDEVAKARGYWHNPNAKWDWYEAGGRWRAYLTLLPGKEGYRVPLDKWCKDFVYPEHTCDSALVADCDFTPNQEIYRKALRRWEIIVEGAKKTDEDETFLNLFKPEYYLTRYGDKETYARRQAAFTTYAFVSADGQWHGQGQMGWFGCDDADNASITAYEQAFEAYLEEAKQQGLMVTIVDCHI